MEIMDYFYIAIISIFIGCAVMVCLFYYDTVNDNDNEPDKIKVYDKIEQEQNKELGDIICSEKGHGEFVSYDKQQNVITCEVKHEHEYIQITYKGE